jgi:hypothetical protein
MLSGMRSPRALVSLAAAGVLIAGAGIAQAATPREWTPQRPPLDLAALEAKVARSVVTITCGSTQGTGFSVFATFSDAEVSAGWKSYIVTTDATIAGCIDPVRDVIVTGPGLTSVATPRVWNTSAGLAAVLSKDAIPPMDIGDTPVPVVGQWIGAMGSVAGTPTPLAQGAVTSVTTDTLTSSLPDPAAFSGGPVIESRGRVIGMMTSSGVVTGTPLFCDSVYACLYPDRYWWVGLRVPRAPTDVTAVAGNRQATVTWKAPVDDGGDEIYAYDVFASPGGQMCSARDGSVTCTVLGLANGTAYTFTVIPYNRAGDGFTSAPSATVTPVGPPSAVTKARAIGVKGGVRVTWAAPESTGGSRITGYEYRVGSGRWMTTRATSITVKARPGSKVTVAVRALNSAGWGASTTVTAKSR